MRTTRTSSGRVLGVLAVLIAAASAVNIWLALAVRGAAESGEEPVGDNRGIPAERSVRIRAEKRVLTRRVRHPAEVVAVPADALTLPPGAGGVVTDVFVAPGDTLEPGDPIVEIDGRAVFGLPLAFPLYRDIAPGVRGRDVEALQEALTRIGWGELAVDGIYGPETKRAVAELYSRVGLSPEVVDAAELGSHDLVRQEASLRRQLERARSADSVDPLLVADLEDQLASTREALADAIDGSGPVLGAADVIVLASAVDVERVPVAVGDRIGAEPVVETSAPSLALEVTAPFDEVALLAPGDRVAAPDDPALSLEIVEVGRGGEGDRRIRLAATEGGAGLAPGDVVVVEFVAETTGVPVVAVPAGFVFLDAGGRTAVLVAEGDEVRTVEVRTGRVIDGMVEIVDGLTPGTEVVAG